MSTSTVAPQPPRNLIQRIPLGELTIERFRREFRDPGRPVIFTGMFECVPAWTLDFMKAKLAGRKYHTRRYAADYRERPKREWKSHSETVLLETDTYMEKLRDHSAHREHLYMAQTAFGDTPLAETIRACVHNLERRTGMVPIVPQMDLNLWLGPAGHTEPLHFDQGDGTLMQLFGAKRVILFPPEQTDNLYPFPFYTTLPPWFAQVDLDRPNFDLFPGYRTAEATKLDFVLEQGEVLFLPLNWWHEITALGDDYVCSVNRFWKAEPIRRQFMHWRSATFYVMNKVPWQVVSVVNNTMVKLRAPKAAGGAR